MSIGISDEHAELAASLRGWAATLDGPGLARSAETDGSASFEAVRAAVREMGVSTIALPEDLGGGGGSVLDQAVALEACVHELVPGPLLTQAVVGLLLARQVAEPGVRKVLRSLVDGTVVGLSLTPRLDVVCDAPDAEMLLVPDAHDRWWLLDAAATRREPAVGLDLTRRATRVEADLAGATEVGGLHGDLVRRTLLTLAAAEAAGIARWCLATAVDYAKVREQFGAPIGSFQAVKHLCAEMLETAEAVTAAAWDVANAADDARAGGDADDTGDSGDADGQWAFSAAVAHVVALDGAVEVAKSCIQVLGGIGFTFEHDAHLYLRRALALRSLLGDTDAAAVGLAQRACEGVRRRLQVDLGGRDAAVRDDVRRRVETIAAADDRRRALVDAGYLTPHWPAPHGIGADAATQLVIDQELARAGVTRPDIVIAGWALPTILEHGSQEQRERFVRPSLLGELVWCQLFSEPGSGSDLASLRTRAERVDGGWVLTGQKVWTSVAHRADWAICLARTDPHVPAHQGISYFLVDMKNSSGIDVRPLREINGDELFNEVFLDDVFVPDEMLVGEPGDGWRLARTTLANERVAMATSRLGASTERAVELVATEGSEPDDGPDDDVRRVIRLLALGRTVALSTVCSLLGARSTLRSLGGHGPGAESSVAKLLGVRSRQDSAELVLTLMGQRGLADDDDARAARWEMLNTRCLSIAGGTTQIMRNVAGERILGLPRG